MYSEAFWVHSLNIGFVNLGPQLEHRVCKLVFLHAGLADLGAMYNRKLCISCIEL